MSGNHICHLESMQRSKSIEQREAKYSIFRSIIEIQTAEPQTYTDRCNRKWQRGGEGQQPNQSHGGEGQAKCATFFTIVFNDSNTLLSLSAFSYFIKQRSKNGKTVVWA